MDITDLFIISFILCEENECDPLSPPEGAAAQGEHPLTPPLFSSGFSLLATTL